LVSGPIGEISERLAARRTGEAEPVAPPPLSTSEPTLGASEPSLEPPAPAAAPAAPIVTAGGAEVPQQARKRLRLRVLGDSRAVAQLIQGGAGVLSIEPGPGGQLSVYYTGDERFVAEVVRHLVAHGVGVVGVEPERNELERIFLEVTRGELQ
jgi:ABC-2 type transport system ATP-binding protein